MENNIFQIQHFFESLANNNSPVVTGKVASIVFWAKENGLIIKFTEEENIRPGLRIYQDGFHIISIYTDVKNSPHNKFEFLTKTAKDKKDLLDLLTAAGLAKDRLVLNKPWFELLLLTDIDVIKVLDNYINK